MHAVEFISIEDDDPDLIVSFALAPAAAHSITLMRTPKYESLIPDEDRGVAVAAGALGTGERELLVAITFSSQDKTVLVETTKRAYRLSVARVQPEEIQAATIVLARMNFDGRFISNAA